MCVNSTENQAEVLPRPGVVHTWQISGGTLTSGATGDSVTYSAGASPVTLTVTATSGSYSVSSSTTVGVSQKPTATLVLNGPDTITLGQSTQLRVNLTGTGMKRVIWSHGPFDDTTSSFVDRTVTPTQTTTYSLESVVSDGCAGPVSGTVTITVTVPGVSSVSAMTLDNRNVRVTWPAVPNATAYRIERATVVAGVTTWSVDLGSETTLYDDLLPATAGPVTYIYYVRVKYASGAWSARGPFDYATGANLLWSQAVGQGVLIRGADIQELRKAIDAFRVAFARPPVFSGSVAPTGLITAANLTALVGALNEARQSVNYPAFGYVNVAAPAPAGPMYAAHIQQLRDALR